MFWDKLCAVCKEKGISPTEAAKRIYAAPDTIAAWRRGATPDLARLYDLAEFLGVQPDDLLGDDVDDFAGTGAFWKGFVRTCKARGTDPYTFAKSIALSPEAVDIWREGSAPGSMVITKIADALGCRVSDLYYYEDVVGVKDVHPGVMLRHELEVLAESLSDSNVRKVIEFAEFIYAKQLAEFDISGADD